MFRKVLRSKISGISICKTEGLVGEDLQEGFIWIDADILKAAEIWPLEEVLVSSLKTGARVSLSVRKLSSGSGQVFVTGAAAILVRELDEVEIDAYSYLETEELSQFRVKSVRLKKGNRL